MFELFSHALKNKLFLFFENLRIDKYSKCPLSIENGQRFIYLIVCSSLMECLTKNR